jgi:hypothetical protein
MKNWQFCMLMATVYTAPLTSSAINIIGAAVFLAGSAIFIIKER